ncbi:PhaM family polyhydroxyalkanoate granule multifunctional regulatory protein, partial [Macromonas nakdongensis]|uniref:PhaM family polyhydroxyalkanoate granule multifunctional regulatory protein n=1 Tax=Macromonas nakdongensis TaxID=1843082 RepID=UPI000C32280E
MTPPDLNAFAQYIPGFEFLQNLTRQAAGSVAPGLQSGVPGMPSMSHWVAPTFDVEELDKRIQDLRAVHFWLDQNTKALGATIQALEVQKMTLATLKGMNVSLGEMAEAFKIRPEAAAPEQPAAQPPAPTPEEAPARPMVDPMQWWNSLTEQFQTIATGAVRDMADQASRAAEQVAQTVQASAEAASQMSASAA